jgi:hypothetical protein
MTPTDTIALLRDGRAVIADPDHWTQGCYAEDANGMGVGTADPRACKFCSIGAIYVANRRDGNRNLQEEAVTALGRFMPGGIAKFNDNNRHAVVLAAWDAAIASLDQPDQDTKVRTLLCEPTGWTYHCAVPPVHAGFWSHDDWIKWIGHGWRRLSSS